VNRAGVGTIAAPASPSSAHTMQSRRDTGVAAKAYGSDTVLSLQRPLNSTRRARDCSLVAVVTVPAAGWWVVGSQPR